MALNFPNSPINGETYSENGVTWVYDSSFGAWFVRSTANTFSMTTAQLKDLSKENSVVTTITPLLGTIYDLTIATSAFNKANAANVLAYNTAVTANLFIIETISGANTAVGTGANAFTSATIAGANNISIAAFNQANTPAGNDTEVQFNNSGSYGATSGLTFNYTSNTLSVSGNLSIAGNYVSPVQSFRNKIINGNFDHWQRGTSKSTAGYLADRWFELVSGSTFTSSRQSFTLGQTDVPGEPTYYHRTVVTSVAGASNYGILQQRIESVRTFAGQTATLSFWAKADASKNIAVEFAQNFGSGGSPSSTVTGIGVTTCALTTSWQKFTVAVSFPAISGKTLGSDNNHMLQVFFWFDAGSTYNSRTNSLGQQSGTFDIAQVQLEAGSVATPFEMRPIGTELALCQRYYQTIPVNAYATNYYYATFNPDYYYPMSFLTQLRATPTLTRTGVTDSGVTGGVVSVTTRGFSVVMQLTSAAGQSVFTAVADAEL